MSCATYLPEVVRSCDFGLHCSYGPSMAELTTNFWIPSHSFPVYSPNQEYSYLSAKNSIMSLRERPILHTDLQIWTMIGFGWVGRFRETRCSAQIRTNYWMLPYVYVQIEWFLSKIGIACIRRMKQKLFVYGVSHFIWGWGDFWGWLDSHP